MNSLKKQEAVVMRWTDDLTDSELNTEQEAKEMDELELKE